MNLPQLQPQPLERGVFSIGQPPYIVNNWRAAQVSDSKEYSQFVKVQGGIATITNGEILLRARVAHVPDGFYIILDDDSFLESAAMVAAISNRRSYYYCESFPDPEAVRPNFTAMHQTPPIPAAEIRKIADFLNFVRSESRGEDCNSRVFFEGNALINQNNANLWVDVGCVVPVNPEHGVFCTNMLRLIFIDMLRYEHVFIGRDNTFAGTDVDARMPLVIGLDWSSCGLIKPR